MVEEILKKKKNSWQNPAWKFCDFLSWRGCDRRVSPKSSGEVSLVMKRFLNIIRNVFAGEPAEFFCREVCGLLLTGIEKYAIITLVLVRHIWTVHKNKDFSFIEYSVFSLASVAQSVEQLIRNQQVRCSSHPTSSIKPQHSRSPNLKA